MHADKAAFLRAIIAAPDDDHPRLVFADWLDEHGEPERAEFVRVQCELAGDLAEEASAISLASQDNLNMLELYHHTAMRWRGQSMTTEKHERLRKAVALRRRERELYGAGAAKLVGKFPAQSGVFLECDYRSSDWQVPSEYPALFLNRGLGERFVARWEDFARHHVAIREATPLSRVRLTTWPDYYWLVVNVPGIPTHDSVKFQLEHNRFPGIQFKLPDPPGDSGRVGPAPLGRGAGGLNYEKSPAPGI